jgi:hypothetical protein
MFNGTNLQLISPTQSSIPISDEAFNKSLRILALKFDLTLSFFKKAQAEEKEKASINNEMEALFSKFNMKDDE